MSGSTPAAGTDRARMTAEQATIARSVDDVGVAGEPPSGAVDDQQQTPQPASVAGDPAAAASDAPARGVKEGPTPLLDGTQLEATIRRWKDIQAAFVDEPQQAVQDADALVADLMQGLAQVFAAERQHLEAQWSRGNQASTEDLRVSLQRYRSFFQRLLSV
jgi:hypothetical protein